MDGKSWVPRAGEYLVGRAARYLPPSIREERHQEWSAELPVILNDPSVRPAVRRAVRMLWFAADTLRGAAVTGHTAAGRHVRRDADGKARDPVAREGLLVLLMLLGLPALLAVAGYFTYTAVSGPVLTHGVPFLVSFSISTLFMRTRRGAGILGTFWFSAITVTAGTGLLLHGLADHFGWGHTLLFAVIYYCSAIILIVAFCVLLALGVRAVQARRQRART